MRNRMGKCADAGRTFVLFQSEAQTTVYLVILFHTQSGGLRVVALENALT